MAFFGFCKDTVARSFKELDSNWFFRTWMTLVFLRIGLGCSGLDFRFFRIGYRFVQDLDLIRFSKEGSGCSGSGTWFVSLDIGREKSEVD